MDETPRPMQVRTTPGLTFGPTIGPGAAQPPTQGTLFDDPPRRRPMAS